MNNTSCGYNFNELIEKMVMICNKEQTTSLNSEPNFLCWVCQESIFFVEVQSLQAVFTTASSEHSQCGPAWAERIMGCEQSYPVCGLVRLKQSIEATFD